MSTLSFPRRHLLRVFSSLGVGLATRSVLAAEPIAVVMSSNSRQRGLSSDKLRRVFLAQPTDDDDGHRFVPINLAQSSNVRERFDRNVLTVRGTRSDTIPTDKSEKRVFFVERSPGSFSRTLRFPQYVEAAKIEAKFENGVLTVTVPKSEAAKPRKITVN